MYIVRSYPLAVILCFITMICWGSWANTQKMTEKSWRFELFYWDYVIGIVFMSLLLAFTLGSIGEEGRSFYLDIKQAGISNIASAFLGGVIFNAANVLVVAAIAIAGMSVAFPIGIGIALIFGVLINYIATPKGDPFWLFSGVTFVTLAILINALAYSLKATQTHKVSRKGITLAVGGGILMALFYRFVASSMATDFVYPEVGLLGPYTAVVIFSCGVLVSNFIFNVVLMKFPVEGSTVSFRQYVLGSTREHLTGIVGGIIWCIGMSLSIISSGKAGYAISYGLGQGATMVAAFWGVFVWKEFSGIKRVKTLLVAMFISFILGLGMIIHAGA